MNEGVDHGDDARCQLRRSVFGRIGGFGEKAVSGAREHGYAVGIAW